MGILGYFGWLKERYSDAINRFHLSGAAGTHSATVRRQPIPLLTRTDNEPLYIRKYDAVHFDLNNLLYTAVSSSSTQWSTIFKNLYRDMDQILALYPAKETLFIALDGPGPVAKFLTQRERRVKSARSGRTTTGFNTLLFTPGTDFMSNLRDALQYYACQRLSTLKDFPSKVVISGADRIGEGELKIFEHIIKLPHTKEDGTKGKHLVIGNDADLILYALRTHEAEVDILRTDQHSRDETFIYIDIAKLRASLVAGSPASSEQSVVDDFVFLSLLMGNDYVSKLRGYVIGPAWDTYIRLRKTKYVNKSLFDDATSTINTEFFKELMGLLQQNNLGRIALDIAHLNDPKHIFAQLTSTYLTFVDPHFEFSAISPTEHTCKFYMVTNEGNNAPGHNKFILLPNINTSPELQRKSTFIAEGRGRTERLAKNDAYMKALGLQHPCEPDSIFYSAPTLETAQKLPIVNLLREYSFPVIGPAEYVELIENNLGKHKAVTEREKGGSLNASVEDMKLASQQKVNEYLRGIVWIMNYLKAKCYDYSYRYTWYWSPTFADLSEFIDNADYSLIKTNVKPLMPLPFLMSLIPSNHSGATELLPEQYRYLLRPGSALQDLYHGHISEDIWQNKPEDAIARLKYEFEKNPPAPNHSHLLTHHPALLYVKTPGKNQSTPAPPPPPNTTFSPIRPYGMKNIALLVEQPHSETGDYHPTFVPYDAPSKEELPFSPFLLHKREYHTWTKNFKSSSTFGYPSFYTHKSRPTLFYNSTFLSRRAITHVGVRYLSKFARK